MTEQDPTCDRCGTPIGGPDTLSSGYGWSLCLACVHPAYGGDAAPAA